MIERISQSFVKAMRGYLAADECGHILRHQYIDGKLMEPTESMAQGSYFEFKVAGNLPKSKIQPVPRVSKKTGKTYAPYRKAESSAIWVKNMLFLMGLKVISVGKQIPHGRFVGDIDLIVEATRKITFSNGVVWKKGYRFIIDLKYSGLIDDRWSKHGWAWTDLQKEYHGTQAIQYHMISGLDFYFWVISSKGSENEDGTYDCPDMKFFKVPVTKQMIDKHVHEANSLMEQFKVQSKIGFVPRPSLKRCMDCPLKHSCEDKMEYPQPEVVDLTLDYGR